MKRYNELKTDAETIRDETSSGANTAARVGGHLADIVDSMGHADARRPYPAEPGTTLKPTVSFCFADFYNSWKTTGQAFEDVYGEAVGLTFFIVTDEVWRGKVHEGTLTFVEGAGNTGYIEDTANPAIDFADSGLAAGQMISINGSSNNDGRSYLVYAVDGNKLYIDSTASPRDDVVAEVAVTCDIHRGTYNGLTYADLVTMINAGHDIGSHTRTEIPMTDIDGHGVYSDERMWEEIYGSKRDLEMGIRAAAEAETRAASYEVTLFNPPKGNNNYRSRRMVRQAGYKLSSGVEYVQTSMIHNHPIFNPWAVQLFALPPASVCMFNAQSGPAAPHAKTGRVSASAASTTLTISDGTFEGQVSVGDPIVIMDTAQRWQFRIVESVNTDDYLSLVVNEAFDIELSNALWFDPRDEDVNYIYGNNYFQSACGYVNHIIANGGLLVTGDHSGVTSAANLKIKPMGATLLYIKWLIDNDYNLVLKSFSEAYDAYAPLFDGGQNFGVNHDGVRIARARSPHFVLNDTNVMLGYNTGQHQYNTEAVLLGRYAGSAYEGDGVIAIGSEAGANYASGTQCVLIGKSAGANSQGDKVIAIGASAASTNRGNNVIALGYRAAYGNNVDNVFIVRSSAVHPPLIWGKLDAGGGIVLGCPGTALADGYFAANRFSFYLDEGNNKLKFKVCYANGSTYKIGEVALSDPA